jgi:hypothetical protein
MICHLFLFLGSMVDACTCRGDSGLDTWCNSYARRRRTPRIRRHGDVLLVMHRVLRARLCICGCTPRRGDTCDIVTCKHYADLPGGHVNSQDDEEDDDEWLLLDDDDDELLLDDDDDDELDEEDELDEDELQEAIRT